MAGETAVITNSTLDTLLGRVPLTVKVITSADPGKDVDVLLVDPLDKTAIMRFQALDYLM